MALTETEAIVIKSMPHGESSKIVRLYTLEYGKMSVIAKGVKSKKSKIGGILEPLNHVKAVIYYKDNRDLQIISECELVNDLSKIRNDLEKLSLALAVLEHIAGYVVEEESNKELFDLLILSLNTFSKQYSNYHNIYWYFLINFLKISGFEMDFLTCRNCDARISSNNLSFSISTGGLICNNCIDSGGIVKLGREALEVIKNVQAKKPAQLKNLKVSNIAKNEIDELLGKYFMFHVEGYKKPESLKLII